MDYFEEVNLKYLHVNKKAEQKAQAIVLTSILTKVSHLFPITFQSHSDEYLSEDAAGCFVKTKYGLEKWRPKGIWIRLNEGEDIIDKFTTILHEVGHFVYMHEEYKSCIFNEFESSELNHRNYSEDLANLFVIDYIETFPIWIRKALQITLKVYKKKLSNYKYTEENEFSTEEIKRSMEEEGVLYLLDDK